MSGYIDNKEKIRAILGWGVNQETGYVDITPIKAKQLLEFNSKNRKVNARFENYCETIISDGEFYLTPDAISFDSNGIISNGQHRLLAIANNNKTCRCLVAIGIEQNLGIDNGHARSVADNVVLTDSCCPELRENTNIQKMIKTLLMNCKGYSDNTKISPTTMIGIINMYKNDFLVFEREGLDQVHSKVKAINGAIVPSMLFVAYKCGVSLDTLIHIKTVLATGELLSDYDKPILACRDKLMTIQGSGREVTLLKAKLLQDCVYKVSKRSTRKSCKPDDFRYRYDFVEEYKRAKKNGTI